MNKLELTIFHELNDLEISILENSSYHSNYVHQRAIAYSLGLSFIALGGGIVSFNFSLDTISLLAFAAIVAGATLQLAVVGYMMFPCQCGKTPVLTAQCRKHLINQQSKRYIGMWILGGLSVGTAWNLSMFGLMSSLGLTFGANTMIAIAVQFFQTMGCFVLGLGLLTFASAVLNKTEWLQTNKIIPQREVEKVSLLSEEIPDELNSIIDFHLKAGNINTAERLSQKLMKVIEANTHPSI